MVWQTNPWLPGIGQNTAFRPESGICCWKTTFQLIRAADLFIRLLARAARRACVQGKLRCRILTFISLVFFQSAIIRREYDELRIPQASYEAFQGEISDFLLFFFPKLIIQEGEMRLIFQGRVQ